MDARSPMRIAIESLADARTAAHAGDLVAALELVDAGLAALGRHYQRLPVLDPSGLALALAARRRRAGDLAGAFAEAERALEDRIAGYAGRDGDVS